MKTLKQLSEDVLAAENAVNLCGVAQSFARAMIDLGEHTNSTVERNEHIITKAWIRQLAYMSGALSPYTISEDCKISEQLEYWAKN